MGPAAGDIEVKITGSGFTAGATVDFGATQATSVKFVSSTEIAAPANARKRTGVSGNFG
jgi:IPT/TIG domain